MVAPVAATIALLAMLYFLLTGMLVARSAKSFRAEARREMARRHWAESRNLLVDLARSGQLSLHSNTFRSFYAVQTAVLRRPDEYTELSKAIAGVFLKTPDGDSPRSAWQDEIGEWPKEMAQVLKLMSLGIGSLLFRHRGWRRLVPAAVKISWLVSKSFSQDVANRLQNALPPLKATALLQEAQEETSGLMSAI